MPASRSAKPNDQREQRRMRAWELHQRGWTQDKIARELGVSQGAVSQWIKRVRDGGGVEALRRHPAPGRRAELTDEQFAMLPSLLASGAQAYGFEGDAWTTKRVAAVLQQVFGVAYHPGHISRLLRKHYPQWRALKTE